MCVDVVARLSERTINEREEKWRERKNVGAILSPSLFFARDFYERKEEEEEKLKINRIQANERKQIECAVDSGLRWCRSLEKGANRKKAHTHTWTVAFVA